MNPLVSLTRLVLTHSSIQQLIVLADSGCGVYMRSRSTQTTSTLAESAFHNFHGVVATTPFPEKGCGSRDYESIVD